MGGGDIPRLNTYLCYLIAINGDENLMGSDTVQCHPHPEMVISPFHPAAQINLKHPIPAVLSAGLPIHSFAGVYV